MENTSNTNELLQEILKYQKKNARLTRISAIAVLVMACVFAVALAFLIPKAVKLVEGASNSLAQVDELIDDTGVVMQNLNDISVEVNTVISDAQVLIDNSNTMVEDNTDAITETVQKMNQVDFETLNKAINDLSDVVEPLANFFNKFSR